MLPGRAGDKHKFHLFAAAFDLNCTLAQWHTNSAVMHAVSNKPEGPFTFYDQAVPMWHHNPQAIEAPDGTYLIYSMGEDNCQEDHTWPVPNCATGNNTLPCPAGAKIAGNQSSVLCAQSLGPTGSSSYDNCASHRIELHHSTSLYGPWQRWTPTPDPWAGSIIAPPAANPAPIFLPNGSVVVVQTSFGDCNGKLPCPFGGGLRVAYADHWKGPYRATADLPFAPCHFCHKDECKTCQDCGSGTINGKVYSGCANFEDPVIWFETVSLDLA